MAGQFKYRLKQTRSKLREVTSVLFYSILGCVLPLQEVALCQSPPSFSVLCYPCTCSSLLPHYVISPCFGLPTDFTPSINLPLCGSNG